MNAPDVFASWIARVLADLRRDTQRDYLLVG